MILHVTVAGNIIYKYNKIFVYIYNNNYKYVTIPKGKKLITKITYAEVCNKIFNERLKKIY